MAPRSGRSELRQTADVSANFQTGFEHHQAGRLDQAETLYRKVLRKAPKHFHALHLLGLIAHQRGRDEDALRLISRALAQSPDVAVAHLNLGTALSGLDRLSEAVASYRTAIALRPDSAVAYRELSHVLNLQGAFEAALENADRAIELMPELPAGLLNRAFALEGLRRFADAEIAYRNALALQPNRAEILSGLGRILTELMRVDEAIDCHRQAIALEPESALAHYHYAGTLLYAGEVEESEASCRRAVLLDANLARAWAELGYILLTVGRFDEARSCFLHALKLDPDVPQAYTGWATLGEPAENETQLERLRALVSRPDRPPLTGIDAGFALGMMLDNADRYDNAFQCFAEANSRFRQILANSGELVDPASIRQQVDALIANCTPDFFSAVEEGNPSELPVFIVGMPRSGTSLVEQILASHSRVWGAGELKNISRIAVAVDAHGEERKLDDLDPDFARRLADEYVADLMRRGQGAVRVTDKMPGNIFQLGLIAVLFPMARVVLVRRDLRDICLSCYFRRFDDPMPWSYDLAECGLRALETERLADHWRRVLPLRKLTVDYEALVADLAGESRRLIEFLGLDWEPACLEFYKTERHILSSSGWQARQPLFTGSVGRWRRYERHLGPLLEVLALGDIPG